ncbi:MAG TPA: tetratricopeptide repeat protein [Ramlibacter sp.]|nr:tetratricopeptide repeat protein [Ramlibacter sp.]
MSETVTTEARRDATLQRLDRLEEFLASDPRNGALRADAFHAALQCGAWDRAERHLLEGRAARPDDAAWALREGDLLLAQRRYPEARTVLEALGAMATRPPGLDAVLAYNLAHIDFSEGNYRACLDRLRPIVCPPAGDPLTQQLWLRALHRAGELEEACRWASDAEATQRMQPAAAGVAALASIDHGQFESAKRWVGLARAGGEAPTMELLVSESSLALAEGQARAAAQFAEQALQVNPQDGRAWSARAFAALLAGELERAGMQFDRAVSLMPQHIGTWHGRAWAAVLRQDLATAQASFETALALNRNFAETHGGLAVVLAMQGEQGPARRHVELAQRLDGSSLSSRYAEAVLSGDAADARTLQRLAQRLLGARKAPLGGTMADWLPPTDG